MKRSRPQGLGASSIKKEKPEVTESASSENKNEFVEKNSEENSSKSIYVLPEEATALDQLRALFESATMLFDDVSKSKPIFNGVIHECLRLESILENEKGPEELEGDEADIDSYVQVKKDASKIFGSEFYFIFGESLRSLAEYEMSEFDDTTAYEQVTGLLSASIDRFQLAKEKEDGSEKFSAEIQNGTIYAMTCLLLLIGDNETLMTDLSALVSDECRELVQSAIFDVSEFFISFLELCHEQDYKYDGHESLSSILTKNIPLLKKINADYNIAKLTLVVVDIYLRLDSILELELDEIKLNEFCSDLDLILSDESVRIRFEALQLKASIKELLGFEDEANAIYAEADSLDLTNEIEN